MLFYIHLLWQNSQSHTLCCSMSCEMQTVLIVEAVVMVRAEPHRQVWRGVSFFDHRYGTPKGQAEGPEKPAAWDYYFQPGAAQERQVSKRGVSSSSLSSSASPKHSDSHRHHTHTEASLACFLYSFVLSLSLSHLYLWDCNFSSTWDLHSSLGATRTPQTCCDCQSTSGLCPPQSAEGGGSALLRLPSGGWNQRGEG